MRDSDSLGSQFPAHPAAHKKNRPQDCGILRPVDLGIRFESSGSGPDSTQNAGTLASGKDGLRRIGSITPLSISLLRTIANRVPINHETSKPQERIFYRRTKRFSTKNDMVGGM